MTYSKSFITAKGHVAQFVTSNNETLSKIKEINLKYLGISSYDEVRKEENGTYRIYNHEGTHHDSYSKGRELTEDEIKHYEACNTLIELYIAEDVKANKIENTLMEKLQSEYDKIRESI
jgi:hypothetical protein